MKYQEYIELGLNGKPLLKLILCGSVHNVENDKVGVVSVIFATTDRDLAEQKIQELQKTESDNYYMVYSVPLNIDLTTLSRYPSIEITKEDLR